ncbi:MAG: maleylpyruvate isomerase family mycothiol-dependent enzyme [Acidimicrobiales bacterium]
MATWQLAAKARNDFADLVEGLTPDQWDHPSYCDEWTARGVLSHLTSFVETGVVGFMATMIKQRFDFNRVSVAMATQQLARPVGDVILALRTKATKSAAMPMFREEMTVTDVAIHTQDVRRPLGLTGELDPAVLSTALEFLTTHKMATMLVDRKPLDGVRLVATDRDWSFGDGAEVAGTGEALMMAMAGRPVLDELSGPGVDRWR